MLCNVLGNERTSSAIMSEITVDCNSLNGNFFLEGCGPKTPLLSSLTPSHPSSRNPGYGPVKIMIMNNW